MSQSETRHRQRDDLGRRGEMIDAAIDELAPIVGTSAACTAVGRPRANHYRWHRQTPPTPRPERVPKPQPRTLGEVERKEVLRVLHSDEHVELLDQGVYLASTSTMYRIPARPRRGP